MKAKDKTEDLVEMRQRIIELQTVDAQRQRAERALRESERRYRLLAENVTDVIWTMDMNLRYTYTSPSVKRMRGYSVEEVMTQTAAQSLTATSFEVAVEAFAQELAAEGMEQTDPNRSRTLELELNCKDGSTVWAESEITFLRDPDGQPVGILGISRDITERRRAQAVLRKAYDELEMRVKERTSALVEANQKLRCEIKERKRAEEALRESEGEYRRLLGDINDAYLVIQDEKVVFANERAVEIYGVPLDQFIGSPLGSSFPADLQQQLRERFRRRIAGEAEPERYELTTAIGKTVEVNAKLINYEGRPAVATVVRDITQRKQAEEERQQNFYRLMRTLEGTVHALASMVEMKDPYTAGHQRGVTQLACAIAKQIGLFGEKLQGIRIAGVLHDIGKVNVPAEILTKPGHLTETEFPLIKTHTQVGHDVVETIDFPWPIAQIVLQHHERMDGSGYPAGLSGEDILLEARILAVADVVEAMASHRPYRPALGLDKALEEISQHRGVLYDPEVVDACLKLFAEKGFAFKRDEGSDCR